jgi:hypothetical protein
VYFDPITESVREQNENLPATEKLWNIFRQGGTLCLVLNLVQKNTIPLDSIVPLNLSEGKPFDNANCKRNVYNFLVSCAQDLFIPEDELFQVSDIYKKDVAVFVKALNLVESLLKRWGTTKNIDFSAPYPNPKAHTSGGSYASEQGSITTHSDSTNKRHSSISEHSEALQRAKVVDEILITERNYVHGLEVLLVSYKDCT